MKKIIFLVFSLIILLNFVSFKVHADETNSVTDPLVVKVGSNLSDYLKYDNYVVVSNSVNINEPGIYTITYKNIDTFEELKKEVHVIDDDKYAFDTHYKTLFSNSNAYELIDCIEYDDKVAWLINYKRSNISNNYYLHVDNINSLTVYQNSQDKMVDLEYNNGFMIASTSKNVMDGDNNIMIFNYDINGYCKIKEYLSKGKEEASCITGNSDYIFVGGKTNEETEMFNNKRKGYDSFILSIDRKTNELKSSLLLSLEGDDCILDMEFFNNYLYIIQSQDNSKLRLLKLDIFGNIICENIVDFNYGFINPKLKLINNRVYFSYDYYEYNYLDYVNVIEALGDNLERNVIYKQYDQHLTLKDYTILDNGVMKGLYVYRYNSNSYCYKMFLNNNEILRLNGNQKMEVFGLYNDFVVLKSPSTIMVNKISSIAVIKDFDREIDPKYENIDNLSNYLVFIDGFGVIHDDRSKLEIDENLYGNYQVDYYFDSTINYLESVDVNLLPYVGVENNKVYDLGIILDGNAIVRVNGDLVETPYKLETFGEYKIELNGLNNQITTLNIKVNKLSELVIKENLVDYREIKNETNKIDNYAVVNFNALKNKEQKSNNYLYFYLIPFIFAGVGFLVVKRG